MASTAYLLNGGAEARVVGPVEPGQATGKESAFEVEGGKCRESMRIVITSLDAFPLGDHSSSLEGTNLWSSAHLNLVLVDPLEPSGRASTSTPFSAIRFVGPGGATSSGGAGSTGQRAGGLGWEETQIFKTRDLQEQGSLEGS